MIVDLNTQTMTTELPQDSPPSYEVATDDGKDHVQEAISNGVLKHDTKHPITETSPLRARPQLSLAEPSHTIQLGNTQTLPPVHHYINSRTGERVTSFLPPNDPEMICLQEGRHVLHTQFGIIGILAAIFWFPLGIGCCILDRRSQCERCGAVLSTGFCS